MPKSGRAAARGIIAAVLKESGSRHDKASMTRQETVFLRLLRAAVGEGDGAELPALTDAEWAAVFSLAERHHLLPLILDAAHRAGAPLDVRALLPYKRRAARLTALQTARTSAFLSLYRALADRGAAPLVMKGLICRALYPEPDFRFSADEDLLIPPSEAAALYAILTERGLRTDTAVEELSSAWEVTWTSPDGTVLLEVHTAPFPPDSGAYGDFNDAFPGLYDRAVTERISDTDVRTLAPADHLLYLACHALKHFLHGGCGVRQLCDVCLFARAYGGVIDWPELLSRAETIRAADFLRAFLALGERHLGVAPAGFPEPLGTGDGEDLLADLLQSGVYGSSTMSRKHSSTVTLAAVENAKRGASPERLPLRRLLFPSFAAMSRRYPWVKRHPIFLPAAWLHRLATYARQRRPGENTPAEALRIGRERLALLERYGLLPGAAPPPPADKKVVDTGEYISALLPLIREGHEVSLPVAGGSMTPFLIDQRDQVFLRTLPGPAKRGDIVLYRRDNGSFVLHRVRAVRRKGNDLLFDIIGDAQDRIERDVRQDQLLAVVTRVRRKGEILAPGGFRWWFFRNIWIGIIPLRRPLMRLYASLRGRRSRRKK